LKAHAGSINFLVHWVVEGSNDQRNWVELDKRDTDELVGSRLVKNFRCSGRHSSEYFHFIRLRQTGKTSSNEDYFLLCNVEFFGILR
jgi:hypothetical protein